MEIEDKEGRAKVVRIGEMMYASGIMKMGIQYMEDIVGYDTYNIKKMGAHNTAIVHHSEKTYALVESNLPFNIKIDQTEKDFDIK